MDDWDRYTLHHREHRDRTVRLHGGPQHGRVIDLPETTVKRGLFYAAAPVEWSWSLDEPVDLTTPIEQVVYRRQKLALYDDVDHAVDYYDYWVAEGTPLPPLRA